MAQTTDETSGSDCQATPQPEPIKDEHKSCAHHTDEHNVNQIGNFVQIIKLKKLKLK